MTGTDRFVVFTIEGQRYGIALEAAERVVMMVEITPLPGVPCFVRGVINVQGEIVPVLDLRRRFDLPEHTPDPDDRLIIAGFSGRLYALIADTVQELYECPDAELTAGDRIVPASPFLSGIARLPDGLILIQNLESLLSPAEAGAVVEAMKGDLS